MNEIVHRIAVKGSSAEEVYQRLATLEGLKSWWTVDTAGTPEKVGGKIEFRFVGGGFEMEVAKLEPGKLVEWNVVGGEKEWIGSVIRWELKEDGGYSVVLFSHTKWKEKSEFMQHCSTKWAIFLMSLKSALETGQGAPNPHDVKIDNWN
ncbi:SRPBCC family protein [Flavobacterium gelatinilyticum]|uniref:SRPBCC family protein n=1 Tax=Flavobacterium gelatinilyticum TaxID=3003260 RepID=UPI0024807304|nr:SRPBCC domain-containing protein [Flavobacterium gelatinilyticum]